MGTVNPLPLSPVLWLEAPHFERDQTLQPRGHRAFHQRALYRFELFVAAQDSAHARQVACVDHVARRRDDEVGR